ncbi:type I 3-dehydroquinate dehydratase [Salimicrobium halophilum]|uniref:3-dehydroquinate dehydratase n=1 Tax=Salimicrobium halophilum TaxID=86666 RepID=A0A1G8USI1_9BACI|nr:type I 3-dehydroquinate dehydratase [Salimicrobium halophilum]SDJ56055.1 3-dehydroquinate dehydratase [Salimicrobium halophilum]
MLKKNDVNICTPIVGRTIDEVKEELRTIVPKEPDLLEWRADNFRNLADTEQVLAVLETIGDVKKDIPLLFTIRDQNEGGESLDIDSSHKIDLIERVAANSHVSLIDFEVKQSEEDLHRVKEAAVANNKQLILSYHDFSSTPSKEEMMSTLEAAKTKGADYAKLSVTPETKQDVLSLLTVTEEAERTLGIPVITMAMGGLGTVTRMFGWYFGSIVTFAVGGHPSAPGQIPIEDLEKTIAHIRKYQ